MVGLAVAFAVLIGAPVAWRALQESAAPPAYAQEIAGAPMPVRGVMFGDTRGRARLEFWRQDGRPVRPRVLEAIAAEAPAFVINSGDAIFDAADEAAWEAFDADHAAILARGIPYRLAYGNHEYVGRREEAERNLHARFGELRHWTDVRISNLLVVILDSNFDAMGAERVREQNVWLDERLEAAEEDLAIARVILVFHHPPFTNSSVHHPDEEAREHFFGRARSHPKVRAIWTGHVHSYEHFVVEGIHCVVSGGGGAPPTTLDVEEPEFDDLYDGPAVRGFHYAVVTIRDDRVDVEVKMLQNGEWSVVDEFELR